MKPLPSPLAVVCHDAGAANLVAAWLPQVAGAGTRLCLHGPADAVFPRPERRVHDLAQAIAGAACVLTGTSWPSPLEHEARAMARAAGIRSIAVVDHWVNYTQRFERGGLRILPDTIWVADEYALAIAREAFPQVEVVQQSNTYLQQQVAQVAPLPASGDVLVLLEPANDNWGRDSPGEFQALDYLVANLAALGVPPGTRLRLRPHPRDAAGKYAQWLARHPFAALDASASLGEALSCARWATGLETNALVVALAARRQAVSTLPPWAPPCRLPHAGIVHLKQLAGAAR